MKELRALRTRKGRAGSRRFLAEGVRVVEDLLGSGLEIVWAATSSSLEDSERGRILVRRLDAQGVRRVGFSERDFENLAATESPQGVLAVAAIPQWGMESLRVEGEVGAPRVVLLLDAVQDPGNFGTLVRSAEALGAIGIIALPGTVDPWNPKSVRAAAGSSFRVPVLEMSLEPAVSELRRLGFRLLGADAAGRPVPELREDRVALFVGNEGAGLSEGVRAAVDDLAAVPLRGRAESLNVAAAAAILLYELTR